MSPAPIVAAAVASKNSGDQNVAKPTWGDQVKSLLPFLLFGILFIVVVIVLFWLAIYTGYKWIDGQCQAEGYGNILSCAFGGTASALTGALGGVAAGLNPFVPNSDSPRDRLLATGNRRWAFANWPVLTWLLGGTKPV